MLIRTHRDALLDEVRVGNLGVLLERLNKDVLSYSVRALSVAGFMLARYLVRMRPMMGLCVRSESLMMVRAAEDHLGSKQVQREVLRL